MAAQHTPGPWEARQDLDDGTWLVFGPDGLSVADCGAPWGSKDFHQPNARLIAAAPEMLAAAQSLINGLDTGLVRFDTDADETLENTMAGLRVAVAKATVPKATGGA
jgi:hypothetical protein